ncbi:MAG: hypothetical protein WC028_02320 [Candidatus Obscuribacterales bacterium]
MASRYFFSFTSFSPYRHNSALYISLSAELKDFVPGAVIICNRKRGSAKPVGIYGSSTSGQGSIGTEPGGGGGGTEPRGGRMERALAEHVCATRAVKATRLTMKRKRRLTLRMTSLPLPCREGAL